MAALEDEATSELAICGSFLGLVTLWFLPSIGLTLLNKWLFSSWHGGFAYPLTATLFHMSMNSFVTYTILFCTGELSRTRTAMSWREYFIYVVPIGLLTGVDISFTNLSFLLLSVSLITIVKSASPFFILLFSVWLGLEALSFRLFGVILVICVGTMIAVSKHVESDDAGDVAVGVLLVLTATMASGARWAITQRCPNLLSRTINLFQKNHYPRDRLLSDA